MALLNRFHRRIGSFSHDENGSFVMIFGLLLIPLVGLLGLGVDYSQANRLKTALDAANDAAVLAALTQAEEVIQQKQGSTNGSTVSPYAISQAEAFGTSVFNANAANISYGTTYNKKNLATYSIQVCRTATSSTCALVNGAYPDVDTGLFLSATAAYSAASYNLFGEIFGDTEWLVQGVSSASLEMPDYKDVYMLLDVSQSMGIASSVADQNALIKLTTPYSNPDGKHPTTEEVGCQFGCHYNSTGAPESYEQLAIDNNIPLRINALQASVNDVINIMQSNASTYNTNTTELGLYTMGGPVSTGSSTSITELTAPINDYTVLSSKAAKIDLEASNGNGTGDSYQTDPSLTPGSIGQLAAKIQNYVAQGTQVIGDGTTAKSPQVYVFIVTDGLVDYPCALSVNGTGHCTSPIDPSECQTLKSMGITVAVVYTTYTAFPDTSDDRYVALVKPYNTPDANGNTAISTALQSCATSSTYFIQATTNSDIKTAIDNLFELALTQGTLTQ